MSDNKWTWMDRQNTRTVRDWIRREGNPNRYMSDEDEYFMRKYSDAIEKTSMKHITDAYYDYVESGQWE